MQNGTMRVLRRGLARRGLGPDRDLAANLAAGPSRAVDVDVGAAAADRRDQLLDLTGVESLRPRGRCGCDVRTHVRRDDGARYGGGRCGTGLSPGGTVAEVGAEKHRYAT